MELKQNKNIFTNPIVMTLCALLCCALWGSATPAIKTASALLIPVSGVPSTILFAGIRFTLAGIITVAIYSIARRRLLVFKRENLPRVLTVSAFQTVIQYIFFYVGLTYTTGVKGTIASGSSAFFCVLIASLIFKQEKLTVKKIFACILGLAGIIIINIQGLELTMNFLGDGFVILSTVAYAFSSVFMKRFSKHEDPVVISGYQFIFGGAFLILLGVILGGRLSFESTKGVLILIYLAFLSAVAYALWGMLLKHNPVSKVTVFTFATPIFGTILSLLLLPESSGVDPINLVITLLLVSAGILLLNYQPKEREISSPEEK
nr:DMT family transporter [Oscillospiraceae bacterium]